MRKRFKTGILVRNNRIQQITDQGIYIDYRVLENDEYLLELKRKIVEESTEVCNTKTKEDLEEEIGDVLEVIEHIVEECNLDIKKINEIKKEKQNKIGKFDKKYKMNYVEMDEDNPAIKYYLDRPYKYPEIKIENEKI